MSDLKTRRFLFGPWKGLLLAALLLALAFSAQAQGMVMMGFEDPAVSRDWSQNRFFQHMEGLTGLSFTFRQYGDEGEYRQALAALGQDGQPLPDVLFKAALSPAETIRLLEAGVLIDLAPYLEAHCPNFFALMEADPLLRQAVTLPGGQIGALPFVETAPAQNVLWINREWLETLKLDMPGDAEAMQAVLQAFKTGDPNRNGRQDELPLSFMGPYDLKYLAHAFGLSANDFNLFVKDGAVRFMPLEEAFAPFLAWCRELYQEGLLAKDGFTTLDAFRRVTDTKGVNRFGAFFAPLPTYLVPMEWAQAYLAVPPLSYGGERVYRAIAQPVQTGTFAITSACEDIGAALNWVDHLYSLEGAVLSGVGLEGADYVVDGDGSWRSIPGIHDPAYQANGIIATGTSIPGISSDAFQRRYTDPLVRALSEQVDVVSAVARVPFPPFSLTAEEEADIAPLQAAIAEHVDVSIARIILGEREITEPELAAFRQELEALGLERFMAFWQTIYDRTEGQGLEK
jgi:putative aldouronate transport system substrate-binding protein